MSGAEQQHRSTIAEQNLTSLERLESHGAGQSWNWFTVRTILTSGAGFFTDSYDVFIINLVTPMLGYVYYSHNNNKMPADVEGVVKGMASVGTFIGQLWFGFMGDIFGRKIYGFELLIIILGTINCATSASAVRGVSAIGFLGLWRLVLGIGVGGDYPMSATITSEWSSAGRRGKSLTASARMSSELMLQFVRYDDGVDLLDARCRKHGGSNCHSDSACHLQKCYQR